MCGIAGVIRFDGGPADVIAVARMAAALRHRGPDAVATAADGPVALGHTRLSIVDVAGGAQPMSTVDGRLSIVFNGEIFNFDDLRRELSTRGYRFRTRCDTEVILHAYDAWGVDCVTHLNGQWAFALWDARSRSLFLSRDRMGVRPLFYSTCGGAFRFASEIKALLTDPLLDARLDTTALAQVFTFWASIPPRTPFAGILQLPPGHSMRVADGRITITPYWEMTFTPDAPAARTADDYSDELWSLLRDATRLRLLGDVPVGAYLSGGLDSSAVAAARRAVTGTAGETFSLAFRDAEFDERPFQEAVARELGARRHVFECGYTDIAGAFPAVIRHAETPLLRTAPAPLFMLSAAVRANGYKVVLTGEGADEILGGYDIFKEAKVRAWCARRPGSSLRPLLLRRLYPYLPAVHRSESLLRRFFSAPPADADSPFFSHLPRWGLTSQLWRLFSAETRQALAGVDVYDDVRRMLPASFTGWSPLARAQYLEARVLLPGYILASQGDRMAMAHSVEIRMPFLDYRVIEFAGRLPDRLKLRALDEKYLLKRCMRGRLPASILQRPKQPYRAPEGRSFFEGTTPEYVTDALASQSVAGHGVFSAAAVDALAAKFRRGQPTGTRDNMALVGVLSTQLLMNTFMGARRAGEQDDADRAAAAAVSR